MKMEAGPHSKRKNINNSYRRVVRGIGLTI